MLFSVWEDARVWPHWNHPFPVHFSYLRPVACAFHFLSSSVLSAGSGYNLMAVISQVFFSFLSVLRAQKFTFGDWESWRLWHPCWLMWQEILHFSGWIPGLGRSHMPKAAKPAHHSYWAHALHLLKCEDLEPVLHRKRSPSTTVQSSPRWPQLEKAMGSNKDPAPP